MCLDYSPPPLWTDQRCPPPPQLCSCMSPKGLSCQSSPAFVWLLRSLSRWPLGCLSAGSRLVCCHWKTRPIQGEQRVSWLNDINSSHPVCQAMPLRQKAVGLLFKVFLLCIIQTSFMVESNCQILWKQVPSSRSGIYMNLKYSYCAHCTSSNITCISR